MIEVEISKDVYLPCFQHLLEPDDIDIELIWGGRDSGKSKFLSQLLTEEAMAADYFRCLLIKETHESIRDAQWQMIKDTAEQWTVDSLFKFTTSPLGISCISGGTFHPRGMDNPGKIRSFSNPSHAWVEEGNQISEEAFITIITGLRSDHGRVKLYFTFNPEADTPDYKDFWIYKTFFAGHEGKLSFTAFIEIKVQTPAGEKVVKLKYRSTHVTYHDNPYVTPQRIAFHESLRDSNYYYYRVFTEGLFGNVENDSPWAYAFHRKKHVSDGLAIPHPVLDRRHPVYLSWDFNRNPMTCSVIQHYNDTVYVLETIRIPKSGVDGMCEYIKGRYPGCLFIVTGDYNGTAESSLYQEQVTHYKLIKHYLLLADTQIKVKPNPKQAKNSTHVNTCLQYYNIIIHGVNASALVFDLVNVKRRADGTIEKANRDDPAQQADALDTLRYFLNMFLGWFKPEEALTAPKITVTELTDLVVEPSKPKPIVYTPDPNGGNVIDDAIYTIYNEGTVVCTKGEYYSCVRDAILKQAGEWIDGGNQVKAVIALQEVKRLDEMFGGE